MVRRRRGLDQPRVRLAAGADDPAVLAAPPPHRPRARGAGIPALDRRGLDQPGGGRGLAPLHVPDVLRADVLAGSGESTCRTGEHSDWPAESRYHSYVGEKATEDRQRAFHEDTPPPERPRPDPRRPARLMKGPVMSEPQRPVPPPRPRRRAARRLPHRRVRRARRAAEIPGAARSRPRPAVHRHARQPRGGDATGLPDHGRVQAERAAAMTRPVTPTPVLVGRAPIQKGTR